MKRNVNYLKDQKRNFKAKILKTYAKMDRSNRKFKLKKNRFVGIFKLEQLY